MSTKTKEVYSDYYKGMKAPIGGNDRFLWVNNALLNETADKSILDVGCGEGTLLKMLEDKGNYVAGIDASKTGQAACEERGIRCEVVDISTEMFPYSTDQFDIVLCLETIEHIENPHHCIWEIKRILKEGGLFIVSIPNFKILHPYVYPGLFEFKNFKQFLQLNSFDIVEIKGWGQAAMLNRVTKWLKSRDNTLATRIAGFIHFLSRKRNLLMRKHIPCPLIYSYSWNFLCINHKKDKTFVEQLAEDTYPDKMG